MKLNVSHNREAHLANVSVLALLLSIFERRQRTSVDGRHVVIESRSKWSTRGVLQIKSCTDLDFCECVERERGEGRGREENVKRLMWVVAAGASYSLIEYWSCLEGMSVIRHMGADPLLSHLFRYTESGSSASVIAPRGIGSGQNDVDNNGPNSSLIGYDALDCVSINMCHRRKRIY